METIYRDERIGDVRDSLADISKAKKELNYKQKIWREINLLYSEIKEVSIKNPEYSCLPCVCLSDVYNKIQLIKEDISFWEKMIPIP